jgi:hypothetical protein
VEHSFGVSIGLSSHWSLWSSLEMKCGVYCILVSSLCVLYTQTCTFLFIENRLTNAPAKVSRSINFWIPKYEYESSNSFRHTRGWTGRSGRTQTVVLCVILMLRINHQAMERPCSEDNTVPTQKLDLCALYIHHLTLITQRTTCSASALQSKRGLRIMRRHLFLLFNGKLFLDETSYFSLSSDTNHRKPQEQPVADLIRGICWQQRKR